MEPLTVHLFGGFSVRQGVEPLPPIPSRAARSLLAYLVVNRGRPHPRASLAGVFWPDLGEGRARRRLSHTLWQIQDALSEMPAAEPYLLATSDALAFNTDASYWLDVEEFERCVAYGGRRRDGALGEDELEVLRRGVELYRGDFMSGFEDEWVLVEQERLRHHHLEALGRLVEVAKSHGRYDEALTYARRLTNHDPVREDAHREVMRLSTLLGRTSQALQQFERCRSVLLEELGTGPAAETAALYERIQRERRFPADALPSGAGADDGDDGRSPFVGRARERRMLVDRLERVLAGTGGVVLVEAPAGVGKSRLATVGAADAAWRGFSVLWAGCQDLPSARPYEAIAAAMEGELTPLRVEQLAHRLEPVWVAEAARVLAGFVQVLDGVPGSPPLPGAEGSQRLHEALCRVLTELSCVAPVLLVLDDVHRADEETLATLRAVSRRIADSRIMLVLTYRADEARQRPDVWEALRDIDRCCRPDRLLLQPLSAFETAELARRSLPSGNVAPQAATRLQRETGGNPLFIVETLRAVVDADRREGGREPQDDGMLPLPGSIRDIITARLTSLGSEARTVLATASVHGPGLDLSTLALACRPDLPRGKVVDALDDLLRGGVLQQADGRYGFPHEQVRRVVSEELTPEQRALLHARVGRAIERQDPGDVAALAYHFTQAGAASEAVRYHRQAAREAVDLHAYGVAARHYREALSAMERTPLTVADRYELLLSAEETLSVLGDRAGQAEVLDLLDRLAGEDPSRQVEVVRRRAWLLAHNDDFGAAEQAAREALEVSGEAPHERVAALIALGTVLLWAGRPEEAVEVLEAAVDATADDSLREAEARISLGAALRELSRYRAASEQLERASRLCEQHDDPRGQARAMGALGAVRMETGEPDQAETCYRRALARCRQIGFRHGEGVALVNLGNVLYVAGLIGPAMASYDEGSSVFRSLGNRRGEATVQVNVAAVRHAVLGDDVTAAQEAEEARVYFQRIRDGRSEALCLETMAGIELRHGRACEAREHVQRGLELLRGSDTAWVEVQLLRTLALVELADGCAAEALEQLDRAAGICREHQMSDLGVTLGSLRAVALAELGRIGEALKAGSAAVSALSDGVDRPYLVHHRQYGVLLRAGRASEARVAIERAHATLQAVLASLPPARSRAAVRAVPEHAAIVADWEAVQPKRVRATLARVEAPTGRPLRDDERIEVVLTVDTPADGRAGDEKARRRRRLRRLLREAALQAAAPTVSDLAEVLDVSPTTVRRDLKALRLRGFEAATRGNRAG